MIEAGRVNRISAAVLVDGNYTKNDKGETVYPPRPKEEIDRIAALVRSAIGFESKRGDQVEVVNLRFAETAPVPVNEPTGLMSYLQFTKDDVMRVAEKGVMALLGLIVLIIVVRPLVRRIVTPEGMEAAAHAAGTASVAGAVGADGAVAGAGRGDAFRRRHDHEYRRRQYLDRRRRRIGRHLQPHLRDDRRRQGAGPGARRVGAKGRRTRREEPERGGLHHPQLAPRGRSLSHAVSL